MREPAAATLSPDVQAETPPGETASISTRFGDFSVDPKKVITFDRGLYGLEQHRRFLLTEVPGWPPFFKLLQAVGDPSLSLIVLPLDDSDGPIDSTDLRAACATLHFDPEATTAIGIVTMRDDGDGQIFTVNLKAPLLIDSQRRSGCQHVFASEKYPLRHPLQAQPKNGG